MWPDQTDRFERLRAALDLARAAGVDVRAGDAVADTAALVDELAADGHPVVTNTWVLNYLTAGARTEYVAALDELGGRLDLSWVFAESPFLTPELPGATAILSRNARSWCSCAGVEGGAPWTTSAMPTPTATGCTGPAAPTSTPERADTGTYAGEEIAEEGSWMS